MPDRALSLVRPGDVALPVAGGASLASARLAPVPGGGHAELVRAFDPDNLRAIRRWLVAGAARVGARRPAEESAGTVRTGGTIVKVTGGAPTSQRLA